MRLVATALVLLLGGFAGATRADDVGYVGDAACLGCHPASHPAHAASVHARALAARSDLANRTCESCHGPGSAHASAAGKPESGDLLSFRPDDAAHAAAANDACMGCHAGGQLLHWRGSSHEAADVSCGDCHAVKQEAGRRAALSKASEAETCARCHPFQRSQRFRNAHMPQREGKMSCSSCHNAHGSVSEAMLSEPSVQDSCYACHAEKRGPFLWEHPPVAENCLSCHEAHGSVRRSMLRLSQPRLCQGCHIETLHPSEARLPANRFVIGGACLQCHPQIHGSNHPSGSSLAR